MKHLVWDSTTMGQQKNDQSRDALGRGPSRVRGDCNETVGSNSVVAGWHHLSHLDDQGLGLPGILVAICRTGLEVEGEVRTRALLDGFA